MQYASHPRGFLAVGAVFLVLALLPAPGPRPAAAAPSGQIAFAAQGDLQSARPQHQRGDHLDGWRGEQQSGVEP